MMNDLYKCSLVRLSLVMVCGFVLAGNHVVGQETKTPASNSAKESQQKKENQQPYPARETQIYTLKLAQANQISEVLGDVYQDLIAANLLRIAADPRTNSIIVSGDPKAIEDLTGMVRTLDVVPNDEKQKPSVAQVRLKNPNSVDVAFIRQQGMSKYPDVNLHVTPQGTILLEGPTGQVDMCVNELRKLDTANTVPVFDVTLRVVWLVSSKLGSEIGTPVPQDLEEQVTKVSQKLDLGELRSAGQFMMHQRTMKGAEFMGTGTAKLQDGCQIEIKGAVKMTDQDDAQVHIHVGVNSRKTELCRLASNISAPLGHPVILGMTPIDSQPSLFVVQIMEAKPVD